MAKKTKTTADTSIYRLIEAGFMARHALQLPLQSQNLQTGDDALLLALHENAPLSDIALSTYTGLPKHILAEKIKRLTAQHVLMRMPMDNETLQEIGLTVHGQAVCNTLIESWQQLEEALMGELSKKQRKLLRKTLNRFVELLALQSA